MNSNVVIVTGISGAGKTTAIGCLEDLGYYCIDNYPKELISSLVDLIREEKDDRFENIALVVNVAEFSDVYNFLESREINVRGLALDAANNKILTRYKYTRRTHPLILSSQASTLEEAIEKERDIFDTIKCGNVQRIDTTYLTAKTLGEIIEGYFSIGSQTKFSISFVSFGYKYGIPQDADIMIDVRFLPNPYWEESLRDMSGDDKPVYDYVISKPETQEFLSYLNSFLDYSLEEYKKQGKYHLTIGIGCTGGQHRSVSIVNYLFDRYKNKYLCHKGHKDKR